MITIERLEPVTSLLLVVDVQERLSRVMPDGAFGRLTANAHVLLESARLLGVPVLASEQYPKGLGPTVAPIAEQLGALGVEPIDKMTFGVCGEPRIVRAIGERSPRAIVLFGMETHVCVFQSARELVRLGYSVHVVADAVVSRRDENRSLGLRLCERAGAVVTPTETVVFDWLGAAGTEEFKAVSKLMK